MPINIDGSKGIRQNTTEVTKIPVGTTAQRPANPEAGMIRFNTDQGFVEWYDDVGDRWLATSSFPGIVATGGTVTDIEQDGQLFRVHTFTSDGTFDIARGGEVECLVVGGGGGGGYTNGAGAGAGGLVFVPNELVTAGSYEVLVGEGGDMSPDGSTSTDGFPGGDSQIFGIKGLGGGPGGSNGGQRSRDGGSGGGRGSAGSSGIGLQPSESGISGFFGFGNDSGTINRGTGGGAAEPGDSQSSGLGGNGLNQVLIDGVIYNFKDMFGTNVGHNVDGEIYFAGGGHSGADIHDNSELSFPVDGALGSGSPAFSRSSTGPALPNTGGGGSGNNSTGDTDGNGGSGVVIVRYRIG